VHFVPDVIDPEIAVDEPAAIDMVVEPNGRPHIAYVSEATATVRYATRDDR
jgi:hypothetical protein